MLWLAVMYSCAAQNATVFNQVIGSTGHVGLQQGLIYSYTVGEAVITTLSSDERILTQGFHQPEHTILVSIDDPVFADWDIQAFPNPVSDQLTIRFSSDKPASLRATVIDLAGRIMASEIPLPDPSGSMLDCRSWQPGVYFIQIRDTTNRAFATIRVIRL